jgi:hypothetical protein
MGYQIVAFEAGLAGRWQARACIAKKPSTLLQFMWRYTMNQLILELTKLLGPKNAVALLFAAILVAIVSGFIVYNKGNYISVSKDFREQELKVIFEAAAAIPVLAHAVSKPLWDEANSKFWIFYSGSLVLVESRDVCIQMVSLGEKLKNTKYEDAPS